MCEILGFSLKRKTAVNDDLNMFYSHSDEHPNGWGLAIFDESELSLEKECLRADRSLRLKAVLSEPIRVKDAIAHIRLATIGGEEPENCHPFVGYDLSKRRWTLAHNGTIFESDILHRYVFKQQGETDSERILLYLIDRMNEETEKTQTPLSAEKRFQILDDIVSHSSEKNKLNLLIYDEELLYVHTNFKNSLFIRETEAGLTFCTRPLTDEKWENVPFCTLLGYQNGKLLFTGTCHHREYIFDENSYKPLYLAFSGL